MGRLNDTARIRSSNLNISCILSTSHNRILLSLAEAKRPFLLKTKDETTLLCPFNTLSSCEPFIFQSFIKSSSVYAKIFPLGLKAKAE